MGLCGDSGTVEEVVDCSEVVGFNLRVVVLSFKMVGWEVGESEVGRRWSTEQTGLFLVEFYIFLATNFFSHL